MIKFIAIIIFFVNYVNANDLDCIKPYSRNLSLDKTSKCPLLNQFIKDNIDSSVYLVTASPFLKNPASLFGHNFILFTKKSPSESISGFTLSFEAVDNSYSGIDYIYKGLFGKFEGRYNIKRFYNNIKLYNNFEDRDLILNKLKFSNEKANKLLLKAWEYSFSNPDIPYFFLNGNCAFYIYDFLEKDTISKTLPTIYYSPQDTLSDLKNVIKEKEIIISSTKKRIISFSKKKSKLSKLYASAQFEIYKKQRNKTTPNLKKALLELNNYTKKNNEQLEKIEVLNINTYKSYGSIELGALNDKSLFSINAVKNTYYDEYGVNKLNILNYSTNNFNDYEREFTLVQLDSKQEFEDKFKDISWNMELKHQRKSSLNFESTNTNIGLGISKAYLDRLFLNINLNSIIDSRFIDIFPSLNAFYKKRKFIIEASYMQKYRLDYTKILTGFEVIRNISINTIYENFKEHESRTYLTLDLRL